MTFVPHYEMRGNARPDTIYIVKPVAMNGPYKIGCASNVKRRVRLLSNGSPFRLELVCSMPGDVDLERRLHAFVRHAHSHCEWFEDCAEVHVLIAWIKSGVLDRNALPEPLRIDSLVRGQTAAQRRASCSAVASPPDTKGTANALVRVGA